MSAPLLFLGHAADRTGPPIYLLRLLRWLAANRPDVRYEIALLGGGPLEAEFAALAPTSVYRGLRGSSWESGRRALLRARPEVHDWWWASRRDRQLQRQMRRHAGCRVVFVNGAPSVEMARHLPPGDRVVLSHVHELESGLRHRLADRDRRFLLEGAERIYAASEAVRTNLVERHRVDPSVISRHPGMVDVPPRADVVGGNERARRRRQLGLPADGLVVGSSGTIDWRKAPDLFLRLAWELTQRRSLPATFVWIGGDAASTARATAQAEELGLGDVVRFVGLQPDPAAWFALLDVFVLPAREDPFPLVCLEAASVGCPVVCFDNGGMPELLEQGCGLVARYPDVGDLADQVAVLLTDPDRRRTMGGRGIELVREQHDVSVLAPRLWEDVERWLP